MTLLTCSEYGNYIIELKFCQGEEEAYSMNQMIFNWSEENECEKLWYGEIAVRKRDNVVRRTDMHGIYVETCVLDEEKMIDKIVLPICPNVHIFGILLG